MMRVSHNLRYSKSRSENMPFQQAYNIREAFKNYFNTEGNFTAVQCSIIFMTTS
jgi:hypothetical protein